MLVNLRLFYFNLVQVKMEMDKNSESSLSFIQMACCVLSCNDSLSSVTISNKMELEDGCGIGKSFCYFRLITMCHTKMVTKNGNLHTQSLDGLTMRCLVEISTFLFLFFF